MCIRFLKPATIRLELYHPSFFNRILIASLFSLWWLFSNCVMLTDDTIGPEQSRLLLYIYAGTYLVIFSYHHTSFPSYRHISVSLTGEKPSLNEKLV